MSKVVKMICDKGMGVTIGNFVRRVVLVSDIGWALGAVRINSGKTRTLFETIDGIGEDAERLITNLQSVKVIEQHLDSDLTSDIGSTVKTVQINVKGEDLTLAHIQHQMTEFTVKSNVSTLAHLVNSDSTLSVEMLFIKNKGALDKQAVEFELKKRTQSDLDGYIFLNTLCQSIESFTFTVNELNATEEELVMVLKSDVENVSDVIFNLVYDVTKKILEITSKF